jgi:serine/threonine protein kinase
MAARKIMRKILSAVSYLHSHNIIHRFFLCIMCLCEW